MPLEIDDAPGATILTVLNTLRATHPGVYERTLDERGLLRRHMNIFLNQDSIKRGLGLKTPVEPSDEVWIIPAVSGG